MRREKIKFLDEIELNKKHVFMRVDFNVPLKGNKVHDDYRIQKTLESIRYVLNQNGRLILASHLGRPKGRWSKELSLRPVAEYLNEKFDFEVIFIDDIDSEVPNLLLPQLKKNQLILLENLRFHPGELNRDPDLAKRLASYTDVYINEGFSISHRNHMSLTTLPDLIPCVGAGFLLKKELEELEYIRSKSKEPFFVLLGGSKVSDKIPLLESLIDRADAFFIGGMPAYTFLHAQGYKTGEAYVDKTCLTQVKYFIDRVKSRDKGLYLPQDHVVVKNLKKPLDVQITDDENIPDDYQALDIGPKTQALFASKIQECHSLFWNGPMGWFESEEFKKGTTSLVEACAKHKEAYRLIGGGQSAQMLQGFAKDFNHVSTGGGASLSFLKESSLPGLESLKKLATR